MSNVLEFRPAFEVRSGSAASGNVSPGGPSKCAKADIIMFPGVRYERTIDPVEPSPEPQRGGRGKSMRRSAK